MQVLPRHGFNQVHRALVHHPEAAHLHVRSLLHFSLPWQEILAVDFGDELVFEEDLEQHRGGAVQDIAGVVRAGQMLEFPNLIN